MRYLGGKSKLSKKIVDALLAVSNKDGDYYEPFVGGGSILVDVCKRGAFKNIYASDSKPELILLWNALKNGWVPPSEMTTEEYEHLKKSEPSALKGFAGFPCSFGGKWFGGMAKGGFRSNGSPRNHIDEGSRACVEKGKVVKDVLFECLEYNNTTPSPGDLVYCDPPYDGTTGYSQKWDAGEFWMWARGESERGVIVLVSELKAPEGWKEILSIERKVGSSVSMNGAGNGSDVQCDKLFVLT